MKNKILVLIIITIIFAGSGNAFPAAASLARVAAHPAVAQPAALNSLALFEELRDTLARFILNELASGLSTIERIVVPAAPVVAPEPAPHILESVDDLRRG